MDIKRIKLISKFVSRLFQNSHNISSVNILSNELPSAVQANYSAFNVKENNISSYANMHQLSSDYRLSEKLNLFPVCVGSKLSSISPKKKYQAIIQSVPDKSNPSKKKQVLEIYNRNLELVTELLLDEYHEKIEGGPVFGEQLIWNTNENKILYIANPKEENGKSFLDLEFEKDEDVKEAFKFHSLQQDLGEQMNGSSKPNLYQYDLEKNVLEQILLPENLIPCFPQYLNDSGEKIILQGFLLSSEFKYGIIHCFNREASIYMLEKLETKQLYPKPKKDDSKKDLTGEKNKQEEQKKEEEKPKFSAFKIISNDPVSMHPILSHDKKKLAYFGSTMSLTHLSYMALKVINLNDFSIKTILPIKDEYKDGELQGICGFYDDLGSCCWLKDSNHFLCSTNISAAQRVFLVDTETCENKQLFKVKNKSDETSIVDYDKDLNVIFAQHYQQTAPSKTYMISNIDLSLKSLPEIVEKMQFQLISVLQKGAEDSYIQKVSKYIENNFHETVLKEGDAEGFLWYCNNKDSDQVPDDVKEIYNSNEKLNPKKYVDADRPLLVMLHGGPHGSTAGNFTILRSYFLLNGFTILAPNYTGSCGFGQKYMENLLGKIGDIDLKEVVGMINQVINQKLCSEKKIFVMGGSYGGYLSAMLAGKHGSLFRGAILQNPVLNIPFNVNITDIPEWCTVEALVKDIRELKWNLSPEQYAKMMEVSPMNYPSKTPILLFLGQKDQRVPYQQGLAYHAQTQANKVKINTYIYPESDHRLDDSLTTNFDILMKAILFIEEQLQQVQ